MSRQLSTVDLDPNFRYQQGTLSLPNGDIYQGEYCMHISGTIWREGKGTYSTQDGHIYIGQWKDDKLINETPLRIIYPNGDEYTGIVIDGKYNGAGAYTLDQTMYVICEFNENKPKGNVVLLDVNEVIWSGPAEEEKTLLQAENVFYTQLSEDLGLGGRAPILEGSRSEIEVLDKEDNVKDAELTHREWEEIIFAKSSKIRQDLDFEDSHWYRKYLHFVKEHGRIMEMIQDQGEESLDAKDKEWYKKYLEFKSRKGLKVTKKDSGQSETYGDFLEKLKSPSSNFLRVFYPSNVNSS